MTGDNGYRTWEEPADEQPADAAADGGEMHASLTPPLVALPGPPDTCPDGGCVKCVDKQKKIDILQARNEELLSALVESLFATPENSMAGVRHADGPSDKQLRMRLRILSWIKDQ